MEGEMADVTQLIEKDHREVEGLFAQYKSSKDHAVANRICDELDAHSSAEEKVFYPVVASEVADGEKLAKEAKDEHGEARQLIGRIRQSSKDDTLEGLVGELEQAISHDVSEEESEMLPKARQDIPADRLEQLGDEFASAKS
jgi:hemerythrin superfamily protein